MSGPSRRRLSGRTVAVIGSGPASLAAAQQLTGPATVAVYERADKPGGLLRYGIPEFKMEKKHLDKRLDQMPRGARCSGPAWRSARATDRRRPQDRYDAVVTPSARPSRATFPSPGRELKGIHQAMEFLPQANRVALGDTVEGRSAPTGKHVVIIGGGDTGADCLGTSIRQGAASITQLEIMPQPTEDVRAARSRGRRAR